jgi:hypothetical protein
MPIDVPKRLFATVPDYVAESLDERAKREGRSTSNLVAFILEQAVQQELEQSGELSKDDGKGGDREE